MGDFAKAFERTMGHEGGYVNDPDDAGGETYRGISRKFNPSWSGWPIVDRLRGSGKTVPMDAGLTDAVKSFYKAAYWDPVGGDQLPHSIAEELFDTGVNMGVQTAVTFLQQGLNLLNRGGASWPDIPEDGRFGPTTLKTAMALSTADQASLMVLLNVLQGMRYVDLMRRNPTQEKYARGWLERVRIV